MKLFVVLVSCVAFVASVPIDTAKDAVDNKVNSTDAGSVSPKSIPYGAYQYGAVPYGAYSYGGAMPLASYSAPLASYSAPLASYSAPLSSYSAPISHYNQFSSPLSYPQSSAVSYGYSSASMPYTYGSNAFYRRDQSALPSNARTIGHLRGYQPSMYAAQSPIYAAQSPIYAQPQVYTLPAASSYSHAYQPYSQSSYPAYSYGYGDYNNYESYSPLYRRSADEPEMTSNSQSSVQPAVNYQTKYIVEQPEYVKDQPQVVEFHQHPLQRGVGIRSANDEIFTVNVIPTGSSYNQLNELHGNDVTVDDKLQLRFQPQYLTNRYNSQVSPANLFSKAASDEQPMDAYPTNADSGDQVYMQFNQYSEQMPQADMHAIQQTPKAADEQMYYPQVGVSQNWGSNYATSVPAGLNQANLPFSQEGIRMQMQNFYQAQYQRQLNEELRKLSLTPKGKSIDELPGLGEKIKAIAEEKMVSNEVPKIPTNDKKDVKDEKTPEKSS